MSGYRRLEDVKSVEEEELYHDSSSGRPSSSTLHSANRPIDCSCACHEPKTSRWRRALQRSLRIANQLLFFSSIGILILSYRHVSKIERNDNNSLLKMTSAYCKQSFTAVQFKLSSDAARRQLTSLKAPLFDKIDIGLSKTTVNGSFWPQNPPSIYQQYPSPEVDAAWMRLADTRGIGLTASEVTKLGKNPAEAYPYPSSFNVPGHPDEKTYVGFIDVFHQVHCLNSFRKMGYPDYYGKFWEEESHEKHGFPWMDHLAHCQYNLLQSILCHADVEVITFNQVDGTPGPFPDFSLEKKCRDYGSILKWKEEHHVQPDDAEWPKLFDIPEGIVILEPEGRSIPPI